MNAAATVGAERCTSRVEEDSTFTWLPDVKFTEGDRSITIAAGIATGTARALGETVELRMVSIGDEAFSTEVARRVAAEILRQADVVDPEKTGADRDAH